jgi:hypothetical protein
MARMAQHAARQLPPVLTPRLNVLVNLEELAAIAWSLASLVAAPSRMQQEARDGAASSPECLLS